MASLVATGLAHTVSAGRVLSAEQPDLVVNGSFEQPDVPTGGFGIFPSIPGWGHQPREGATSTGIELQDHSAGSPAPGAGDQFAELDSDGPGHVFQDVATHPGLTYRLTFISSPRRFADAADNAFRVTAGPATLEVGPHPGGTDSIWTPRELVFVAAGPMTRLDFLDLGPEQPSGGVGAYIDLVALRLVPGDADGDGFADDVELAAGTDPLDPASVPPIPATEKVAGELDATAKARPASAPALKKALKELLGSRDGSPSSGALDKLRSRDHMAALEKLSKTPPHLDQAESDDPGLDLTPPKRSVTAVSRTVARSQVQRAQQMAPGAPQVAQAQSLLAEGDRARLDRQFTTAAVHYKKAAGKVQTLLGG